MTAGCCPSPDIQRHGGNGRPKVILSDGSGTAYYARPSKWGEVLQDTFYLDLWRQRKVAIGLVNKPELLVSVSAYKDDSDPDTKKKLNEIVGKAKHAAGASDRAELGVAIHKMTELLDGGNVIGAMKGAGSYGADLKAYMSATKDLGHEHIEHFMVNDVLRTGGTPDRLTWVDNELRVFDVKTGDNDTRYPDKAAIQMAIYAHSQLYNVKTGFRTEANIEQDWGVLCELPAGTGECRLWKIDLEKGWEGVLLAQRVRDWRNDKNFLVPLEVENGQE